MAGKVDAAAGVVSISIGGFAAVFAPADAEAWATLFMDFLPLFMIMFLIWRIRRMDMQLKEAQELQVVLSRQLLLAALEMQRNGIDPASHINLSHLTGEGMQNGE